MLLRMWLFEVFAEGRVRVRVLFNGSIILGLRCVCVFFETMRAALKASIGKRLLTRARAAWSSSGDCGYSTLAQCSVAPKRGQS
jgi:hypothetical protein